MSIRCYLDYAKNLAKSVYDDSYKKFTEKYGSGTIATSEESVFNRLKALGQKVALVSYNEHQLITKSESYKEPVIEDKIQALLDSINSWFEKFEGEFSEECKSEFKPLVSLIEEALRNRR